VAAVYSRHLGMLGGDDKIKLFLLYKKYKAKNTVCFNCFLRTGCQDREYSFADVFLVFWVFFAIFFFFARLFLKIRLKNLTGHDVLDFPVFLHLFE